MPSIRQRPPLVPAKFQGDPRIRQMSFKVESHMDRLKESVRNLVQLSENIDKDDLPSDLQLPEKDQGTFWDFWDALERWHKRLLTVYREGEMPLTASEEIERARMDLRIARRLTKNGK